MGDSIKSATFNEKKQFALPKDATIVKKDVTMSISEIENGFLITKNYDIKWSGSDGETHYDYVTKQWYSEKNPITIDEKLISNKKKNNLVSVLDDDNDPNTLD